MAKKTVKTVNVIEMADGKVLGLTAFPENKQGNKDAEKRFKDAIGESAPENDDEDIQDALDEGHCESGTWEVWLVHSN